ncbi:MAG: AAA family ATPase [Sphaerochaetaceae bacterium]|nr:AAA family ATPase [Sphaerochaetaceae bacterium]
MLIEGARRVGKSTIAEEFGKQEYDSYLLIDFSKANSTVKSYFYDYMTDLDTFFMLLSTAFNIRLVKRKSLIVFDEVQLFPKARECIKHLVADGRYDYLETGSLISIRENVKDILIPSEERSLKMYPLDFEEFCLALNEGLLLEYIRKCFADRKPLDRGMHTKALLLFKQYMLVGGMPQSVVAFIMGGKDFEKADIEKRDILKLYRDDIMKIKSSEKAKVLSIFDQLPGLLSSHEKRVIYKRIQKGSTSDQYEDTFFWLEDSMICNPCFNCSDPQVGLSINEDRTYIKCYMGDTGLLVSHAFDENELSENRLYYQILNDKLQINEGMFYENVIAQMLVSSGHRLFFFTHYNEEKHRNDIEIDFIISNGSKLKYRISPIEVKSTKKYSITSLERFRQRFGNRIESSIVIHPKNLKVENGIVYIPAYMAFCL